MMTEEEKIQLYKQIIAAESENGMSVSKMEWLMKGLKANASSCKESKKRLADFWFADVVEVFQRHTQKFAQSYFDKLFPSGLKPGELSSRLSDLYKCAESNQLKSLAQLILQEIDNCGRRQRAHKCFSDRMQLLNKESVNL